MALLNTLEDSLWLRVTDLEIMDESPSGNGDHEPLVILSNLSIYCRYIDSVYRLASLQDQNLHGL